jgi:hypothetical protein
MIKVQYLAKGNESSPIGIYRTHFIPCRADARYSDMTDLELLYRCLGIILESIAFSGHQVDRGNTKTQPPDFAAAEEE